MASAPGKRQWSTTVDIAGDAAKVSVAVPILPEDSAAAPPPASGSGSAPPPDQSRPGGTQRTIAIAAGVGGIVGIGIGTFFGLKAGSTWNDAKSHCSPYPHCGPEGAKLSDDASSQATISTIGFVVGGVALAAGAVLWFTAPSSPSEGRVGMGIGPTHVSLHGRF
jgi:serine/threonine-protein kinase